MKKLLALIVLFICSCDKPSYIEYKRDVFPKTAGPIRYFKDTRTNICFAETGGGNNYSFTCVPCDSVKKFIK